MNKLPENWWCKCTNKHNQKILADWKGICASSLHIGWVVSWCKNTNSNLSDKQHNPTPKCKGYDFGTEISFETFERLVLGINKTNIYELW